MRKTSFDEKRPPRRSKARWENGIIGRRAKKRARSKGKGCMSLEQTKHTTEGGVSPVSSACDAEKKMAAAGITLETLHIVNHPLIRHKLTLMREKETGSKDFRELLSEIAMLMGYEITRDLPTETVEIETPLVKMRAEKIGGKKLAIIPILRAGLGMVDGLLSLVPVAKVGHIGLYRDPQTHRPVEYYCKLPADIGERYVIVCDPMLATGGSASGAVEMLKARGCSQIKLLCLVSAPEGVKRFQMDHPEVEIYTAALDDCLNDHAYILPGLGDAGDRLFGTK